MFKLKRSLWVLSCASVLGGCASSYQSMDKQVYDIKPVTNIKLANSNAKAMYQLGRYYQGKADYTRAIKAYQQALNSNPDYVEVHNGLGVIYSVQGQYELALQHFQKAIALAPMETYLFNNLGYTYLLLDQENEAEASFKQALRLDPTNHKARSNLKVTLERMALQDDANHAAIAVASSQTNTMDKKSLSANSPQTYTVQTPVVQAQTDAQLVQVAPNVFEYKMVNNNSVITVSPEQSVVSPDASTFNKKTMRIEVSNGNGVTGMARQVSSFFEQNDFDKARLTNHETFQQLQTEIYYRAGSYAQANHINRMLPKQVKLVQSDNLRSDIQVKILLGRDFRNEVAYFKQQDNKRLASQNDRILASLNVAPLH